MKFCKWVAAITMLIMICCAFVFPIFMICAIWEIAKDNQFWAKVIGTDIIIILTCLTCGYPAYRYTEK